MIYLVYDETWRGQDDQLRDQFDICRGIQIIGKLGRTDRWPGSCSFISFISSTLVLVKTFISVPPCCSHEWKKTGLAFSVHELQYSTWSYLHSMLHMHTLAFSSNRLPIVRNPSSTPWIWDRITAGPLHPQLCCNFALFSSNPRTTPHPEILVSSTTIIRCQRPGNQTYLNLGLVQQSAWLSWLAKRPFLRAA